VVSQLGNLHDRLAGRWFVEALFDGHPRPIGIPSLPWQTSKSGSDIRLGPLQTTTSRERGSAGYASPSLRPAAAG
jgi:hypothetical protein